MRERRFVTGWGRLVDASLRFIGRPGHLDTRGFATIVAEAREAAGAVGACDDAELRAKLGRLPSTRGWSNEELTRFLALAIVATERTLGISPYPPQLAAVCAVVRGAVIEMDTGEGKTLVGGIAALAQAVRGRHVTVLSVNDYLADRDARYISPLMEFFGRTVAAIGERSDDESRRAGYGADVTYLAVHELGFDVLRDRLRARTDARILPPRDVVIVDEADAVMIDEATVPLILAGPLATPVDVSRVSREVAKLRAGEHFELSAGARQVSLTAEGTSALEAALGVSNLYDLSSVELLIHVNLALHARLLLERDVDYLVRDGRIEIVNASRGRVGLLHRWPDGLQAAVEAKEGLPPSEVGQVLDSMTVEDLLGGFAVISGMTGTALRVASEIEEFYGVAVGRVERYRPDVRKDLPIRVFATAAEKNAALTRHVREAHDRGQPVLIGTQSVVESEDLAARLRREGLQPQVLNARNDAVEAELVARAGEIGQITISTQMAGRGTDIRLGHDETSRRAVIAAGGLAVVGTSPHRTRRLDQQLRGRAGRQGDVGQSQFFVSLEDDLITRFLPWQLRPRLRDGTILGTPRRELRMVESCQRAAEGAQLSVHRATWLYDRPISEQRAEVLALRERLLDGGSADGLVPAVEVTADDVVDLDAILRDCSAAALDQTWREHLELLTDVRDGIYLRSLGGDHPVDAFTKIAVAEFAGFFDRASELASDLVARAIADGSAAGVVNRPSTTWTYLSENPFGSAGDRFVQNFGRLLHGRRQSPS